MTWRAAIGSDATGAKAAAGYGRRPDVLDTALTRREEGSVTYYGRGGTTWLFTKSGCYTLNANDGSGKQDFDAAGKLTKSADRNGNATTLADNGDLPATIVCTRGTQAQKSAVYASASWPVTTLSQTGSNGRKRTATYTVNGAGDLASVKDTPGRTTSFAYATRKLTSITNPGGGVTRFTYGSIGVISITQENKAPGSPGDSVTRLSYADPAKSGRVKAMDAAGRERPKTYTACRGRPHRRLRHPRLHLRRGGQAHPGDHQLPSTSTKIGFAYDDRGRRTDTYYGTNDYRTVFKARVHQDYVTLGPHQPRWGPPGNRRCPHPAVRHHLLPRHRHPPGTCSSARADNRSLLQWSKDNLTGNTTGYTYDGTNSTDLVHQTSDNGKYVGPTCRWAGVVSGEGCYVVCVGGGWQQDT